MRAVVLPTRQRGHRNATPAKVARRVHVDPDPLFAAARLCCWCARGDRPRRSPTWGWWHDVQGNVSIPCKGREIWEEHECDD